MSCIATPSKFARRSTALSFTWLLATLLAGWLALALAGCGGGGGNGNGGGAESQIDLSERIIAVVTTTGMINDIVLNVGGDRVRSRALMGPGVDPHLYKASEGDVGRLTEADVIFFNGLHLEAKMGEVLARMNRRMRTVAVGGAIDPNLLLSPPQFAGTYDPHIWMDVSMWMQAAGRVRDVLIEMDPGHESTYTENASAYLEDLADLHAYVKERLAHVPAEQRVLVTAHDAFGYFGRAYDIEVRGLQGISTVSEAGTADVQELAAFIAARRIRAVFVESSVPPRAIEAVRAAVLSRGFSVNIGGQLFSDAMGAPGTPEGTYLGMLRHNVDTITAALWQE
jgi:manganese/zinc/iron transport system substrate-binding protein